MGWGEGPKFGHFEGNLRGVYFSTDLGPMSVQAMGQSQTHDLLRSFTAARLFTDWLFKLEST